MNACHHIAKIKISCRPHAILLVFCVGVKPGLVRLEENTLSVSEYRVLRRMCVPKRDEVIGGWINLHCDWELHSLYSSRNDVRPSNQGG